MTFWSDTSVSIIPIRIYAGNGNEVIASATLSGLYLNDYFRNVIHVGS